LLEACKFFRIPSAIPDPPSSHKVKIHQNKAFFKTKKSKKLAYSIPDLHSHIKLNFTKKKTQFLLKKSKPTQLSTNAKKKNRQTKCQASFFSELTPRNSIFPIFVYGHFLLILEEGKLGCCFSFLDVRSLYAFFALAETAIFGCFLLVCGGR
jgi:hypothetical protein